MLRFICALVLFLAVVGGLGGMVSASQPDATPTPVVGTPDNLDVLCDAEIDVGELGYGDATPTPGDGEPPDAGIRVVPPGIAGIATPEAAPDLRLYPVVITLPPGACVPYHEIAGAAVLFVQEGSIFYMAHAGEEPLTEIQTGHMNVKETFADVQFDKFLRLGPGAWVTQNKRVWFSYRNVGYEDAVITMAALVDSAGLDEDPTGGIGGCNGGCRKH